MKVLQGQSIFDIAIQELGSAEGAYALAELNGLSITDELMTGHDLSLPDVQNRSISNYYANKAIKPATADNEVITDVSRVFFKELPIEFT